MSYSDPTRTVDRPAAMPQMKLQCRFHSVSRSRFASGVKTRVSFWARVRLEVGKIYVNMWPDYCRLHNGENLFNSVIAMGMVAKKSMGFVGQEVSV